MIMLAYYLATNAFAWLRKVSKQLIAKEWLVSRSRRFAIVDAKIHPAMGAEGYSAGHLLLWTDWQTSWVQGDGWHRNQIPPFVMYKNCLLHSDYIRSLSVKHTDPGCFIGQINHYLPIWNGTLLVTTTRYCPRRRKEETISWLIWHMLESRRLFTAILNRMPSSLTNVIRSQRAFCPKSQIQERKVTNGSAGTDIGDYPRSTSVIVRHAKRATVARKMHDEQASSAIESK
jgi:hypothetical protein